MSDQITSDGRERIPKPRSTFIRDAQASLEQKYRLMRRVAELEAALGECVTALADTYDGEEDNPEPACSVKAKKLLGWTL